jgi:hypothetical protein
VARRWRSLADDALADEEAHETFRRRFLHTSTTLAGTVRVDGELDADGGAVVIAALDALDTPDPVRVDSQPRTRSQRRADALVALASGSGRAVTLDVVIDAETLSGDPPPDLTAAHCDLDGAGPVARSAALRLACDAAVGRVVRRGDGEILDLGRRIRLVSAAQRRALVVRDGRCGFPGCDSPHQWCDAHHVVHWVDGGPTDLDNLILLCRRHHVLCHEGGWHLARGPGGKVQAVPP